MRAEHRVVLADGGIADDLRALVLPLDVEEMSGYAIVARRHVARIVGGFGGVNSALLAAIADAL